jgi:hypothetical protein
MTLFGHYGAGLNPNYERLRDSEDASDAEQKAYRDGLGTGYDRISMSTSRLPSRATVGRPPMNTLNAAHNPSMKRRMAFGERFHG